MANPIDQEFYGEIRVLLVTDNSSSLHAISKVFNHHPDMVVVATVDDCNPALDLERHLKPQIILVDLDIKSSGGRETIICIRRALPDIAIIALSLSDLTVFWKAALEAGANEVVHKLSLNSDLLPACWRVLQR